MRIRDSGELSIEDATHKAMMVTLFDVVREDRKLAWYGMDIEPDFVADCVAHNCLPELCGSNPLNQADTSFLKQYL